MLQVEQMDVAMTRRTLAARRSGKAEKCASRRPRGPHVATGRTFSTNCRFERHNAITAQWPWIKMFTLDDLSRLIAQRAEASAEQSYTRTLLDKGVAHCAKKFGEQAFRRTAHEKIDAEALGDDALKAHAPPPHGKKQGFEVSTRYG
jgi:hypothetical protein